MQLRIYLSSTFEDLQHHRERVYRELRALRHDVIAMEDYVAADQRPLDKCLEDVRSADVYVGVFAWRYGYVPKAGNPEGRSITELELEEATRLGKPCLVFVLNKKAPWPPPMMDATTGDAEKGAKIDALRDALMRDRLAGMFETADELAVKVVSAIYRWQIESSAPAGKATPTLAKPGEKARGRDDFPLLWLPGSRLRVRFLDGDPILQRRVLRMAQIWTAYANVSFEPSEDADAEVRVGFDEHEGSWSYEGTKSLAVASQERTANFGWLRPVSPIDEIESVVVHEFGHVLGLAHEHCNPDAQLRWNIQAVYRDMTGPPNYWQKAQVDNFIFNPWARDRFPFAKPFDPSSVMAFAIPEGWIEDGRTISRNVMLSAADREFISRLYPYVERPGTRTAARKLASPRGASRPRKRRPAQPKRVSPRRP